MIAILGDEVDEMVSLKDLEDFHHVSVFERPECFNLVVKEFLFYLSFDAVEVDHLQCDRRAILDVGAYVEWGVPLYTTEEKPLPITSEVAYLKQLICLSSASMGVCKYCYDLNNEVWLTQALYNIQDSDNSVSSASSPLSQFLTICALELMQPSLVDSYLTIQGSIAHFYVESIRIVCQLIWTLPGLMSF